MIEEYIRYRLGAAHVEDADAFVRAYESAAESLRASEHCLGYALARCTEEPACFILRIDWDSADGHMKGFRSSPQFRAFFQHIQPYVKDIEEMRHYAPTSVKWQR